MLPVSVTTIRLFLPVLAATVWVGGQLTLAGVVPGLRRFSPEAPRAVARRFNAIAWAAFAVSTPRSTRARLLPGRAERGGDHNLRVHKASEAPGPAKRGGRRVGPINANEHVLHVTRPFRSSSMVRDRFAARDAKR